MSNGLSLFLVIAALLGCMALARLWIDPSIEVFTEEDFKRKKFDWKKKKWVVSDD